MADLYAVPDETLTGIADAIRSKTGSDDFMTVASMASAIEGISGGSGVISGTVTIASNSQFDIVIGTDDFTHFLLVLTPIPEKTIYVRQMLARYNDFGTNTGLLVIGASSAQNVAVNGTIGSNYQIKNGSTVTERAGAGSAFGTFNPGDTYTWYAW